MDFDGLITFAHSTRGRDAATALNARRGCRFRCGCRWRCWSGRGIAGILSLDGLICSGARQLILGIRSSARARSVVGIDGCAYLVRYRRLEEMDLQLRESLGEERAQHAEGVSIHSFGGHMGTTTNTANENVQPPPPRSAQWLPRH